MTLFKLTIEGIDQTVNVANRLIELTMTDKSSLEADELSLTLNDTQPPYLPLPQKGNKIQLWLADPHNQFAMIDKGTFTIDEAEHAGTPDHMTIKAKAADFKSELKVKHSESHHDTTLHEIANKIGQRHKLQVVIDPSIGDIPVQHIDQTRESDLNLLARIADDHDLLCTIKAGKLLLKPKANAQSASGKALVVFTITRQIGDNHSYSRADRDTDYDDSSAEYHNKKNGKIHTVKADKTGKTTDAITDTKLTKTKLHPKPAKNKTDAEARAKSSAKQTARQKAEFSISCATAYPAAVADAPVKVQGFRTYIDAHAWTLTEITHKLSNSGYTSDIKLEAAI